jgi:hypothetical protein
MGRKLAHIEIIEGLFPISGADKIDVAQVLGWECVVKKGEFKVGDKVVYIEVDSIVPERPEFEFLRERKFRVKTIKLRGQISQGLVLPISILNEYIDAGIQFKGEDCFNIGQDVTELLNITKYLSPSEQSELQQQEERIKFEKNKLKKFLMRYSWFKKLLLSKSKKTDFPHWVSKTNEERIQNIPSVLERFKDKKVYVTEKIDYQSVTFTGKMMPIIPIIGKFLPKRFKFVVCSRTLTNNDKQSLYWKIAKKYNIEQILRKNPTLTIQGEQGNTNVQSNKYGITGPTLWVFNIIDHEKNYHYNYKEMKIFCAKNNLPTVPLLHGEDVTYHDFPLNELGSTVQELVEFAKGKSTIADIQREGIVVRCIENGKKLMSFKVMNPNFLLKYE